MHRIYTTASQEVQWRHYCGSFMPERGTQSLWFPTSLILKRNDHFLIATYTFLKIEFKLRLLQGNRYNYRYRYPLLPVPLPCRLCLDKNGEILPLIECLLCSHTTHLTCTSNGIHKQGMHQTILFCWLTQYSVILKFLWLKTMKAVKAVFQNKQVFYPFNIVVCSC